MMEAAEPWNRENLAAHLSAFRHLAASRCLLAEAKVGPVFVIIADKLTHEALQMTFIQNDHLVEKIVPACADPAFGYAILPGTAKARLLRLDTKALYDIDDLFIEIAAAIKDQILGRGVIGECLAQLLDNPRTRRMASRIAVKNTPPVMRDDEEAVPHTECKRRDGEKVHGCDHFAMVAQECRPSLRRLGAPRCFLHPAQYGSLGDIEAENLRVRRECGERPM